MTSVIRVLACAWLLLVPTGVPAQQTPPGFSTYLVAFLTRGQAELPAGVTIQALQKGHLANLTRMWEEGLLLASGPMAGSGDLRGLVIFRGDARAAIDARLADDPLIKTGRLKATVNAWMGPSGIGDGYRKWAAANPGAPDKMRTYQLVLLKRGTHGPLTADEQRAHLIAMDGMAKSGALVTAGPILEPGELAGLFFFSASPTEADTLAATDPTVQSGRMTLERHSWMVAEGVMPNSFRVPIP